MSDNAVVEVMRMGAGYYWAPGGYEIVLDDGKGGTGEWVVCKRGPGATDNPRAFCKTLRAARQEVARMPDNAPCRA